MQKTNNLNCWSILEALDIFSLPVYWYIGGKYKVGSGFGGCETILVVVLSIIIIFYSAYVMFSNKKGSYIYYDTSTLYSSEKNITYFDDFEIFIFPISNNLPVKLDLNVVGLYLEEHEKINSSQVNFTSGDIGNKLLTLQKRSKTIEFQKCDNDYFFSKVAFPFRQIDSYCIDINEKNARNTQNLTYTISSKIFARDLSTHPVISIKPRCLPNCTDNQHNQYTSYLSSFQHLKVFVIHKVAAPINLANPAVYRVSCCTFSLEKTNFEIYFRNYTIMTEASIWPYTSAVVDNFYTLESFGEGDFLKTRVANVNVDIFLHETSSVLERKYDKIDTLLGNSIGVFNFLVAIGRVVTLLFAQYSPEISIINSILNNCTYDNQANSSGEIHIVSKSNFNNRIISTLQPIPCKLDFNESIHNIQFKSQTFLGKYQQKPSNTVLSSTQTFRLYLSSLLKYRLCRYRDPQIKTAHEKICIVRSFFDVSTYMKTVLDVHKIKRLLFQTLEMRIFNSLVYSHQYIQSFLNDLSKTEPIASEVNELQSRMDNLNGSSVKQYEITKHLLTEINNLD